MKITTKAQVNFTFHLVVTEGEMRALDALVGYGFEPFVKAFYEKMGKAYLEPYHEDLKGLFNRIEELRPHLSVIDTFKKEGAEISKKYNV
jgi:hypothetical protein